MTAFEKWKRFIEHLVDVYLIVTPQEKERLQAELSVIEKTNCAEIFQAIYDAWHSIKIKGIFKKINRKKFTLRLYFTFGTSEFKCC